MREKYNFQVMGCIVWTQNTDPQATLLAQLKPDLEEVQGLVVHLWDDGGEGARRLLGRECLPQDTGVGRPVRRARRPQQLEDVVQLVALHTNIFFFSAFSRFIC